MALTGFQQQGSSLAAGACPVAAQCRQGLVEEEPCIHRAQDLQQHRAQPGGLITPPPPSMPNLTCQTYGIYLILLGKVPYLSPAVETEAGNEGPHPDKGVWLERGL